MVSSSASVHSMALQCWRTGEYIGGIMMQDLRTYVAFVGIGHSWTA